MKIIIHKKKLLFKGGVIMGRDLINPNSIRALEEMKTEIARELGISDMEAVIRDKQSESKIEINKRMSQRYQSNLIGFK